MKIDKLDIFDYKTFQWFFDSISIALATAGATGFLLNAGNEKSISIAIHISGLFFLFFGAILRGRIEKFHEDVHYGVLKRKK